MKSTLGAAAQTQPDQPVVMQPQSSGSATEKPWFWLLIVGVAISVLVNLILLMVVLSK